MIKRAHYHQQYLLIKEAHKLYPDFEDLSEMEKQAVLKHIRRAGKAVGTGAKKVGDTYTHTGRRLGSKLEASNLPAQGVIGELQTAGTILGTGGGGLAAGTSLAAGLTSLRKATAAQQRLSEPLWKQRRHTYKGFAGQARKKKDQFLVKYHALTSEKVLKGTTTAADANPAVYNMHGRLTAASPFQYAGLM